MAKKNSVTGKVVTAVLMSASLWMVMFPPENKGPKRKSNIPQAQRARATARVQDAGMRGPFIISERDQQIIRVYLKQDALQNCPPRLAKTNCLPRDYYNKAYELGQALPDSANPLPLPPSLAGQLRHLEHGQHYAMVGGDVLLIMDSTLKVMDAVTLSSVLVNEK